jgi:hypothetical protein
LVFLIILIVATAMLIVWLLALLARAGLGEFRFSRLREGSVQSAPSVGPRLPPVERNAADSRGADSDTVPDPGEVDAARGERDGPRGERVVYDETDVEMAVRDRLYGRYGRRD